MFSETKKQVGDLVEKIGVLDFVIQSLAHTHEADKENTDTQFKQASAKKLLLTEEVLRLLGA